MWFSLAEFAGLDDEGALLLDASASTVLWHALFEVRADGGCRHPERPRAHAVVLLLRQDSACNSCRSRLGTDCQPATEHTFRSFGISLQYVQLCSALIIPVYPGSSSCFILFSHTRDHGSCGSMCRLMRRRLASLLLRLPSCAFLLPALPAGRKCVHSRTGKSALRIPVLSKNSWSMAKCDRDMLPFMLHLLGVICTQRSHWRGTVAGVGPSSFAS